MPTVSGRVVFDINRNENIGSVVGIANLPVVLQNTASLSRLTVLTDATGAYSFINVPAGAYRLVEAYGLAGGVPTPGDFSTAVTGPVPTAQTPPAGSVPSAPPGTTNIDCVTPNTLLITVAAADIPDQNIFNGPVAYTPLASVLDPCTVVFPLNLVTDASDGTFGAFSAGTAANTGTPTNPYPGISPDFTYVVPDPSKYTPIDGEFTIQNTMNDAMSNVIGAWWRISDHTTGNETGRMMVVNEEDPGDIIFRTAVTVNSNTTYLFSTWIMNLFRVGGFPGPQFAVRIIDQEQNPLYESSLGGEIPVNAVMPEWKEIGGVINSRDNTQLIIEFFSQGEATVGNDFVIDDIALRQVILPQFDLVKTESRQTAAVGDTVTYTVTLNNVCEQPLTNVVFHDFIPMGLEFVAGSVVINGVPTPIVNPLIGFSVPDITGGSVFQVSFQARVISVPPLNPAVNTSAIRYVYTPVPNGIEDAYSLTSNAVELLVESPFADADLSIQKTANKRTTILGDTVIFCVTVTNLGPAAAQNVLVSDPTPPGLAQLQYSADNGLTWYPWNGSHSLGLLSSGESAKLLIRGTVSVGAAPVITNTATVTSTTPDPNPSNNTARASVWLATCAPRCDRCCCRCGNQCCDPCRCKCRPSSNCGCRHTCNCVCRPECGCGCRPACACPRSPLQSPPSPAFTI